MSLERFVEAQDDVYEDVLKELRSARKQSHWMWFVFPQIKGLGFSGMSQRYAIASIEEAQAYLVHPILGPRLRECVAILNQSEGRTISQIMGSPDDIKLRSCLTLFARATEDNQVFLDALDKFYGGEKDPETLKRL
ncbi:MAG TPA: DUF1810 domain-containing protein [Bryobacteraceae bacterium]|jgi:uncharacterized protein (DUF1810 family)